MTAIDATGAGYEYGRFDFHMNAEQEERARRLHASSVIIDLHFQGPTSPDVWTDELLAELLKKHPNPDTDQVLEFLPEKAVRGEYPPFRELFTLSGATAAMASCTLGEEREMLRSAYHAARVVSTFDWARRAADGGVAYWGVCAFNFLRPGQLDLIDFAHELGVLDVCDLAYNTMNFVAAGCTERYDPGLSHFGLDFVQRCNDVGVIVDTAHTGKQSTLDACKASTKPVVATHTGAERLYKIDRAKSDDEIKAIADTGGVIGAYAVSFYMGPPEADKSIELTLDNIDYIVDLVGWEHAAIGTDWPMALPPALLEPVLLPLFASIGFRPEHNMDPTATLDGFRDPRDLVNITRGLVKRGYSDDQIRGVMGENFIRVFETVCG
jgi:membrane dipeptidase